LAGLDALDAHAVPLSPITLFHPLRLGDRSLIN
jgi:hypothetical protein